VIDVLDDDTFIALDSLKVVTPPEVGTVSIDEGDPADPRDDVFVYHAEDDYIGTVTFRYKIVDAKGNIDEAVVTLNVDCASSQTSDSGSALGKASAALMMLLTMIMGLYFVRKEEEKGERA
jgi:hypothetical protein